MTSLNLILSLEVSSQNPIPWRWGWGSIVGLGGSGGCTVQSSAGVLQRTAVLFLRVPGLLEGRSPVFKRWHSTSTLLPQPYFRGLIDSASFSLQGSARLSESLCPSLPSFSAACWAPAGMCLKGLTNSFLVLCQTPSLSESRLSHFRILLHLPPHSSVIRKCFLNSGAEQGSH